MDFRPFGRGCKAWELAFDRPHMLSPFIRHAYLEDTREDRETVFVILAEDFTHSRLLKVNQLIIEAPVVGRLELRYIPLQENGHPSAFNYVHAGDPDNCSVHEAKICVSIMFPRKYRDGSVFVPPICKGCGEKACASLVSSKINHRRFAWINERCARLDVEHNRNLFYRAYLRMEEKDETPVDMSLIPLCVKYNAEHFITYVKMWNSTLDSMEALQALLKEDNSEENKKSLEEIVD